MKSNLRFRLAFLCTAMTSIVLAVLMGIFSLITEWDYKRLNQSLFQSQLSQITDQLLSGRIKHHWLSQFESDNQMIVSITDEKTPLFFQGSWEPSTSRELLIQKTRDAAAVSGYLWYDFYSMETVTDQFHLPVSGENGDSYRGAVVRISGRDGNYSLTAVSSRASELARLHQQRLLFLAVTAVGVLVFAGLSWVFAGIAVRPAEQSIEAQNAFVAAASHELRSPLAAVSACASAILIDRDKTESYVRTITKECSRLGRLVDDLLLLAHSDVKGWDLKKEPVDLNTLLIEIVEQLAPAAAQKQHRLTLELPDEESLPLIQGSRERLCQAIFNLISNAVCYSGRECGITVRGSCSGGQIIISVIDHGVGIPDTDKEAVFRRFYRADQTRSDKTHFGLGLSITKELVTLHGGRLLLKDTPGGGCTFSVILPVTKEGRQR